MQASDAVNMVIMQAVSWQSHPQSTKLPLLPAFGVEPSVDVLLLTWTGAEFLLIQVPHTVDHDDQVQQSFIVPTGQPYSQTPVAP